MCHTEIEAARLHVATVSVFFIKEVSCVMGCMLEEYLPLLYMILKLFLNMMLRNIGAPGTSLH